MPDRGVPAGGLPKPRRLRRSQRSSTLRRVNIERLHAIANALLDKEARPTEQLLTQLVTGLENMAREPAQPTHQQNVSSTREQLSELLRDAPSNHFSPGWKQSLRELGIADLVGEGLRERIEAILESNEMTPSAAAGELTPIATRVSDLRGSLENIHNGCAFFEIGAEELAPGEYEVGFAIPRGAVDDEIGELGEEFVELKRILGPFLELATGTRDDIKVRSIASSEFEVLLYVVPSTALLVATALDRIISVYERLVHIKLMHKGLQDDGVPDDRLQGIVDTLRETMSEEIEKLKEELLHAATVKPTAGRDNELRNELTLSLNGLANRIDEGYGVEVRSGELPEPAEDEEGLPDEAEARRTYEVVLEKRERLTFKNVTGQPILQLPDGGGPSPAQRKPPRRRSTPAKAPPRSRESTKPPTPDG
jgi:hypothetical protein